MPVAKSFQNKTIIGEPYMVSGRMYVKTLTDPNTQATRQVRWYTQAEYNRMYPNDTPAIEDKYYKSLKEVLGFNNGYITIFKGDTYGSLDWFRESIARYHKIFGWYIISTEELPSDIPASVTPVRLYWEDIAINDTTLKNEDSIKAAVESLIYEPSCSRFVGEIGQRLTLTLTVKRAIELTTGYGGNLYVMEDIGDNVYTWATSSRTLIVGNTYTFRGTVKDHVTYRNTQQTVLTRCQEVKK